MLMAYKIPLTRLALLATLSPRERAETYPRRRLSPHGRALEPILVDGPLPRGEGVALQAFSSAGA